MEFLRQSQVPGAHVNPRFVLGSLCSEVACETDPAALGAALAGGLAAGAVGGYFFGKQQGESISEKYEKFWPRKIMMLFGAPGAGKGTQAGVGRNVLERGNPGGGKGAKLVETQLRDGVSKGN